MKVFIVTQNFLVSATHNSRSSNVELNFTMRVVHAESKAESVDKFIEGTSNVKGERIDNPISLELNEIITIK